MEKNMKRFMFWVVDCWRVVMDNRFNPLRHIPDASIQAYFTLVLFTIWSVTFGFIATYYLGWYGYDTLTSIIVHLSIVIPLIFTNVVFKEAEENGSKWYTEYKQEEWKRKLFPRKSNVIKWDIDKEA
tara:strand:+ start:4855 stop:5235 length:381 start_codon:yes stop_codon:yes gene_type:complete